MMAPAYSNNLAGAVAGGFKGIQDAFQARDERHGMESMLAIANNADASDPNVANSISAVASQMGLDPRLAQGVIKDDLAEQRRAAQEQRQVDSAQREVDRLEMAKEQASRQQETREEQKAVFEYTMKSKQKQDEETKAAQLAVAEVTAKPEDEERIISSLPPEHQGAARQAIADKQQMVAQKEEYKQYVKDGEPFKDSVLTEMEKTPGMEHAISAYNKQVGDNPRRANAILLKQWEKAKDTELFNMRDKDVANKPLAEWEMEFATEAIKGVIPDPKWWRNDNDEDLAIRGALARSVAEMNRKGPVTPTQIKAELERLKSLKPDTNPNTDNATELVTTDPTPEQHKALPSGTVYTIGGQQYTKR